MAFIIRDTNPQYGGECYFVGTRKVKDNQGRPAEAADFGDRANARQFGSKKDAERLANNLNKIANKQQFVVEEVSIYMQQYGRKRKETNGFVGFEELPQEQVANQQGGFKWQGGYNGF